MFVFMKQTGMLPVVEHMLGVYKVWYGYRDHFPKKARYTLADKIDTRFISVLELLAVASYQNIGQKAVTLDRAVMGVDVLKFLIRIAWELHILDEKKYTTLSTGIQEAGRQIGAWRNGIKRKTPAE